MGKFGKFIWKLISWPPTSLALALKYPRSVTLGSINLSQCWTHFLHIPGNTLCFCFSLIKVWFAIVEGQSKVLSRFFITPGAKFVFRVLYQLFPLSSIPPLSPWSADPRCFISSSFPSSRLPDHEPASGRWFAGPGFLYHGNWCVYGSGRRYQRSLGFEVAKDICINAKALVHGDTRTGSSSPPASTPRPALEDRTNDEQRATLLEYSLEPCSSPTPPVSCGRFRAAPHHRHRRHSCSYRHVPTYRNPLSIAFTCLSI